MSSKNTDSKCESNGYSKKSENPYETGFFRKAIPVMPKPLAIICCLLNIIFPGLGTLISSFSVFCCSTHSYESNMKAFLVNLLAFFLQLVSSIFIYGWIWSIKYGLLFIHLSEKTEEPNMISAELPLYIRRHSSLETNAFYNVNKPVNVSLAKVKEEC